MASIKNNTSAQNLILSAHKYKSAELFLDIINVASDIRLDKASSSVFWKGIKDILHILNSGASDKINIVDYWDKLNLIAGDFASAIEDEGIKNHLVEYINSEVAWSTNDVLARELWKSLKVKNWCEEHYKKHKRHPILYWVARGYIDLIDDEIRSNSSKFEDGVINEGVPRPLWWFTKDAGVLKKLMEMNVDISSPFNFTTNAGQKKPFNLAGKIISEYLLAAMAKNVNDSSSMIEEKLNELGLLGVHEKRLLSAGAFDYGAYSPEEWAEPYKGSAIFEVGTTPLLIMADSLMYDPLLSINKSQKLESFLKTFQNVLTKKIDNAPIWMHLLVSAAHKPGCGISGFERAFENGTDKDLGQMLHENWADFIIFMSAKKDNCFRLEWQKITSMALASKARVDPTSKGKLDLYVGGVNPLAKLFATNIKGISFKYIFEDVEGCLLFEANRRRSSAQKISDCAAAKSVLDDFAIDLKVKKWLLQEIAKSGYIKNDYAEIVLTNERRWLAEALFREVGMVDGLTREMAVYIMEDPYIKNSKEIATSEVDAIILKLDCGLNADDTKTVKKSI
jgi:hypothetical protein